MAETRQTPPGGPAGGSRFAALAKLAPVLLALLLFAGGVFALHRLLAQVNIGDVLRQVRATPLPTLAAALAATFGGYLALIGYDWSALRYLGKHVPFPIVAIGGFLGYSFGNTIGISAISGGAVRYRIYSAFGLNAFEVAAVSTFVALAFGIGITVFGLGALTLHPHALDGVIPWSPGHIRLAASAVAASLLGGISYLSFTGKSLRLHKLEIPAPTPGVLFSQLLFTALDTTLAALTLYVLLPAGAPDFITFLAVFAAAVMIGVLSHVPGGVGVFESIIIATLPAAVPLDQAAAALLLYRLIYYLVPFSLAMVFVALNEARLARGPVARLLGDVSEQMQPVNRAISSIAPSVTGTAVLGLGVWLLLMAIMPSVRPHEVSPDNILVAVLLEGGAILSAVLGVAMILLAQGLYRRLSEAFWLTLVALMTGAFASALNGLDFRSAALMLAGAAVLWPLRHEFFRSGSLTHDVLSPAWFALLAGIALSTTAFVLMMHEATPYSNELWIQFAGDANAPRALRAGLIASALMSLVMVYLALRPARRVGVAPSAAALHKAAAIIARQQDPDANLALAGDKTLFFSENDDAFLMYAIQGRSWVVYGDPVGPSGAVRELAWSFYETARGANARPVFYKLTERYRPLWLEMGLTMHEIGEEGVVHLPAFRAPADIGRAQAAAPGRDGAGAMSFTILAPPHDRERMSALADVSRAWLASGNIRERRFTVGPFDPGYLSRFPIAVLRRKGRIVAFCNILSAAPGGPLAAGLMRYLPGDPQTRIRLLFVRMLEHYRDCGAAEFSLGMAPLAGLETRLGSRLWSRFGAPLFRQGDAFGDFAKLRAFKQKFAPEWQSRYLAVPGSMPPLDALRDIVTLITGDSNGGLVRETRTAGRSH